MFAGPLTAALVNRYGYRKVGMLGSVLACTSCLLTSATSSLYVSFVTYGVIGGLGFGMMYVPSIVVVGFYFEKLRPLATGISACGAGMGGIILPPVLSIILDNMGWQVTFRILALTSVTCASCMAMYKPLKPIKVIIDEGLEVLKDDMPDINSTITLFQLYRLPRNVSSETILSTSTNRKDSVRSVKTVRTEASHFSNVRYTDSKLPTVVEEHLQTNKCNRLFCCFR